MRIPERPKEKAEMEIHIHCNKLLQIAEELVAAHDPYTAYNAVHRLRSVIGMLDDATTRYRKYA